MRKCDCKGLPADTGCIDPSRDEAARLAQRPKKRPDRNRPGRGSFGRGCL